MYDPSLRRVSFLVRTITARETSPFLTAAPGIALFTETTIRSPTPAYRRSCPPRTRIQRTFLAPELSATTRFVSSWIIGLQSLRLFCFFHDFDEPPPLPAAQRANFHDLDHIADARFLFFVVRHQL